MGRRGVPLKWHECVRSRTVAVAVSPWELEELERAAAGGSLSTWIREAALEKARRVYGPRPVAQDDLEDVDDPEGIE